MPRHCCVPACKSNYASSLKSEKPQTTFSFPKDKSIQDLWLRKIHREDYTVTKCSAICARHFNPEDVERTETWKDAEGSIYERELKYPKLKKGAVPQIFPNQPKYLTTPKVLSRRDPSERKIAHFERQFNDMEERVEEFLNRDLITNYDDFLSNIDKKVSLKKWNYKAVENTMYFYYMNIDHYDHCDRNAVKVLSSVRISDSFKMVVCLDGHELSDNDLKWIIPDAKLTRWSQLENIPAR